MLTIFAGATSLAGATSRTANTVRFRTPLRAHEGSRKTFESFETPLRALKQPFDRSATSKRLLWKNLSCSLVSAHASAGQGTSPKPSVSFGKPVAPPVSVAKRHRHTAKQHSDPRHRQCDPAQRRRTIVKWQSPPALRHRDLIFRHCNPTKRHRDHTKRHQREAENSLLRSGAAPRRGRNQCSS